MFESRRRPWLTSLRGDVPVGVEPVVLIVSVEEQVALQMAGEKAAVAPTGSPETEKVTA